LVVGCELEVVRYWLLGTGLWWLFVLGNTLSDRFYEVIQLLAQYFNTIMKVLGFRFYVPLS
jgi:hypothetical protein